MKYTTVWAIIGIFYFFAASVINFKKCNWGIRREYLDVENRESWQRNKAFLQLGIACAAAIAMFSDYAFHNYTVALISSAATVVLFFLLIANEQLIQK